MKRKTSLAIAVGAAVLGTAVATSFVIASDHDDGTSDMKTMNTNLTDLYVFNEKDQNPSVSSDDLIFIMNSNPRSVAGQQYFFNDKARYEFHVTRVSSNDDIPTGKEDVLMRFEFSPPDANNRQNITVTAIKDGITARSTTSAMTTPLGTAPLNNAVPLADSNLTVFAGLREDPFFFDVDQFLKVRQAAAEGHAGSVTFRNPGVDFTAGFNVLSIVARVPREFLKGTTSAHSFDVWETISVRK